MQSNTNAVSSEPDLRPKALRYRQHAAAVEDMIVAAIPEIVAKLMSMAKEGNVAAARYLIDRIHGRPARLQAAPTVDRTLPYEALDWSNDLLKQKDRRDQVAAVYMPKPEAAGGFPGLRAAGGLPSIEEIRARIDGGVGKQKGGPLNADRPPRRV